jgi:hypothetical protein
MSGFRITNPTTEDPQFIALEGQRVYVSTQGIDLPGRGSYTDPYRTTTYAISQVEPETIIYVLQGDYEDDLLYGDVSIATNLVLYFETGAFLHSTQSMGIITTSADASIIIGGQGIFSADSGLAFYHTGIGTVNIEGAYAFSSVDNTTIEGVQNISNVTIISCGSNNANHNAIQFHDRNVDDKTFRLGNVNHITSEATCIRTNIGDSEASTDYRVVIYNLPNVVCANPDAENCIESSPPTGAGAANIIQMEIQNCYFQSTNFVGGASKSAITVNQNHNCSISSCVIVSNANGLYIHTGAIANVFHTVIITDGAQNCALGGGTINIASTCSNTNPGGAGLEAITVDLNSNNTFDARVSW